MVKLSISVDVPDREKATDFYVGALGCKKLRDATPNMTILLAGNVEIYLLERPAGSKSTPDSNSKRSYERHWTPIHLDFGVDDVQDAISKVLEHGGSQEGSDSGEWGAIAYCADPFGNGFCLIKE